MREPAGAGSDPAYGLSTGSSLLRLGGGLGIAACVIGLLIFVTGCFGLGKVLVLSLIPVGLCGPKVVLYSSQTKRRNVQTQYTPPRSPRRCRALGLLLHLGEDVFWHS